LVQKSIIPITAFTFLNTPYRKGGKSPFGIDAAGFKQIVYKLCGVMLPRTASEQSALGEVLSFIEESESGDLAFFDNKEGTIIHVGIVLENNYIIHVAG
jgi:cell wall-associated NlpC family hydrolase